MSTNKIGEQAERRAMLSEWLDRWMPVIVMVTALLIITTVAYALGADQGLW